MNESLPHCTAILKDAGLVDTSFFTDYHRDRGSALHKATEYLDQGRLDRSTVDEAIVGRLAQYERFLAEVQPEIIGIEVPVLSLAYGFCGTYDRRLFIGGRCGILDIKGPTVMPATAIQLAGYVLAAGGVLARWSLHLSDDHYRLIEHTDRRDFDTFKAAVTIANFRRDHGLIDLAAA